MLLPGITDATIQTESRACVWVSKCRYPWEWHTSSTMLATGAEGMDGAIALLICQSRRRAGCAKCLLHCLDEIVIARYSIVVYCVKLGKQGGGQPYYCGPQPQCSQRKWVVGMEQLKHAPDMYWRILGRAANSILGRVAHSVVSNVLGSPLSRKFLSAERESVWRLPYNNTSFGCFQNNKKPVQIITFTMDSPHPHKIEQIKQSERTAMQ